MCHPAMLPLLVLKTLSFFQFGSGLNVRHDVVNKVGPSAAPTAIRQILEIQFAVVGIPWRLQRANRVEALNELIPAGSVRRHINKANPCRVCALEIFTLMANLSLMSIGSGPVRGRRHAQQTIASLIRISGK